MDTYPIFNKRKLGGNLLSSHRLNHGSRDDRNGAIIESLKKN